MYTEVSDEQGQAVRRAGNVASETHDFDVVVAGDLTPVVEALGSTTPRDGPGEGFILKARWEPFARRIAPYLGVDGFGQRRTASRRFKSV